MLKIKKKLSGLLAMAMAITTCMNYAPPIFAQEGEAAKTIIHCTFEKDGDTESWYASAADGSLATVSTTSGALKFSDKGKDDWEGPQYTLDGQLEADKTYEISFDAKSEEDVSGAQLIATMIINNSEYINWNPGKMGEWLTNIAGKEVTTQFQSYKGTFKLNKGVATDNIKFKIETSIGGDRNGKFDFYLDNVMIKEVATSEPQEPQVVEVYHADFEDGTLGGWINRGDAQVTVVANPTNASQKSIKVTNRTQGWQGIQIDLADSVNEDQEYTYSFKIYHESPNAQKVVFTHLDGEGYHWAVTKDDVEGNNWTEVTGTYTVPAGSKDKVFYIEPKTAQDNDSLVDFYIDDVVITTVEEEKEPIITTVYEANFENDDLKGWKSKGSSTIAIVANPTNSSEKSLKVTGRTDAWNGPEIDLSDVVTKGQEYTYSFKVYQASGNNETVAFVHDGNNYAWIANTDVVSGEWAEIKGTYTAPAGSTNMNFYVQTVDTKVDFYIDDVVITTMQEDNGNDEDINKPEPTILYDFEDGQGEWDVRENATLSISPNAYDGNNSLSISKRNYIHDGPIHDMTSILTPGATYEFSVWVKYDGTDEPDTKEFEVCMENTKGGSPSWPTVAKGSVSKGQWTQLKGRYTIPKKLDKFEVYVQTAYTSTPDSSDYMAFSIDNFMIEKKVAGEIQKDIPNLWEAYDGKFKVGAAVAGHNLSPQAKELVAKHFNSITAENEMKPESMLKQDENKAYFAENGDDTNPQVSLEAAETFLTFAQETGIAVRGHVLVWHSQTPVWFFKEGYDENAAYVSKEKMIKRMDNYIKNVFEAIEEQYPDVNIYAWDVVNETIDPSQPDGYRKPSDVVGEANPDNSDQGSLWMKVIGKDFVKEAFKSARKYAPAGTLLAYNDYQECEVAKRDYIYELCKELAEEGLLDIVGMQGHYKMGDPSTTLFEEAVRKYGSIVKKDGSKVEVQITELDIVQPSNAEIDLVKQAYRYKEIVEVLVNLKEEGINVGAVVVWGVRDNESWIGGYPLLFDQDYRAKPAFWGLVDSSQLPVNIQDAFGYRKLSNAYGWELQPSIKVGNLAEVKVTWDEANLYVNVEPTATFVGKTGRVSILIDKDFKQTSYEKTEIALEKGAVAVIPVSDLKANKQIGLDVAVTVEGKTAAWNDKNYSGTPNPKNFGRFTLKEVPKVAEAVKGTPTVDGTVDAIWAKATSVNVDTFTEGKTGATATGKMLWDEENIYVLMEVKDSLLSDKSGNDYEHDSVEIFIDENNAKTNSYQSDDVQYRINFKNKRSINGAGSDPNSFKSATQIVEGGYLVEVALPHHITNFKEDQVIGFELQVNNDEDGNGKRDSVVNWSDLSGQGWNSTENYGLLKLVGNKTDSGSGSGSGSNSGGGSTTKPEVKPEEPIIKPENVVFNDVAPGHWANTAIQRVVSLGLFKGTAEGVFSPKSNIVRGDMAIVLVRLMGLEGKTASSKFSDIPAEAYYAQAVGVLQEMGIMQGDNGKAYPKNAITRQDAIALIGRVLEGQGVVFAEDSQEALAEFKDANQIASYANKYITAFVKLGIIQGYNGEVNPKANITRAEMAVIIDKVYDLLNK